MEVYSTLTRKVYLEAVFGTSNFILDIFNKSVLSSKIGWNLLTSLDRISFNCSTNSDTFSYALMISKNLGVVFDKPFV